MKLYLDKIIDYGGFSRVYVSRVISCSRMHQLKPGDLVVVKKSHVTKHVRNATLHHEASALLVLKGHVSIPTVYAWGRSQYYEYLAMEQLGEDLSSVLHAEGGLTMRSLVGLVCQMLDAVHHVHSHGILHCDIKPDNFLLPLPTTLGLPRNGTAESSLGQIKLIDFGLARPWRNSVTQLHVPKGTIPGLMGTALYASIAIHNHHRPSRRDDIESLAYTIVKLLRGRLPWRETKQHDLLRVKLAWSGASICLGYPPVFADFFDYARAMVFDAEPDYVFWRRRFEAVIISGDEDSANRLVGKPGGSIEPCIPDAADVKLLSSKNDDDELNDSDDHWIPTSTWPPPHCVKDEELFGDEEAMVRAHLERIEEPPAMERRWLRSHCVEVMCS